MEKTYFEYLRRKWQQARRCELCRFYVPDKKQAGWGECHRYAKAWYGIRADDFCGEFKVVPGSWDYTKEELS